MTGKIIYTSLTVLGAVGAVILVAGVIYGVSTQCEDIAIYYKCYSFWD